MPTSMVLRFRDLVAPTIPEHRTQIERHGYVWWGWWNKPDERIPRVAFDSFREIIRSNEHLDIYLADSGRQQLYKARLIEIRESSTEDSIECPERDKTPDYYRSSKYKTWFRLQVITDVRPQQITEELRRWSYDEVLGFSDDPYVDEFRDKRIYSIQEMLNRRHRTIYFIQPFAAQHRTSLVELVPSIGASSSIPPQGENVEIVPAIKFDTFITEPVFRHSTHILHLSDLHFGETHHAFARDGDRVRRPLAIELDEDLRQMGYKTSPAAVMITGDLTWVGSTSEFKEAAMFIKDLQSIVKLDPEDFVVIPGNHDIQWAPGSNGYDRTRAVTNLQPGAEANYRNFFRDVFGIPPNEFLSMGRRFILGNYVALDLVGLNSCRLEQRDLSGHGFVGLPQVNHAAERMRWDDGGPRVAYRMLALHHHVVPVTAQERIPGGSRDYSLTLDSEQLVYRALELGVEFIAHGHMHQPFASSISVAGAVRGFPPSRSIGVHGAGSAGVKREDLGAIGKNSYTVWEVDADGVTVSIRAWEENIERFGPYWSCRFERNPDGGTRLAAN